MSRHFALPIALGSAAVFMSLWPIPAAAQTRGSNVPGNQQLKKHIPSSPSYGSSLPNGSAARGHIVGPRGPSSFGGGGGGNYAYNRIGSQGVLNYGYAGPGYGYGYVGRTIWPGYPGGIHPLERQLWEFQWAYSMGNRPGAFSYGPVYLPAATNYRPWGAYGYPVTSPGPLFIPSGALFGPQNLPQLWNRPVQWNQGPLAMPADQLVAADPVRGQPAKVVKPLDPAAIARADRMLQAGDLRFAAGKYLGAYEQYQSARTAAPAYAATHFRKAWSQAALQQYPRAAETFKDGLRLDDRWPLSNFSLSELYGENKLEQNAHLSAVAAAAEKDPENGDLLFLVGLHLYFSDQKPRSKAFFERAAARSLQAQHLLGFLEALEAPPADVAQQPAGQEF